MAPRFERGGVRLFGRAGVDRAEKHLEAAAARARPPVAGASIDGGLCGVRTDGVTFFELAA